MTLFDHKDDNQLNYNLKGASLKYTVYFFFLYLLYS